MTVKTADGVFVMKAAGETLLVSCGETPVHASRAVAISGSPGYAEKLETGLDTGTLSADDFETVEGLLSLGYLVRTE